MRDQFGFQVQKNDTLNAYALNPDVFWVLGPMGSVYPGQPMKLETGLVSISLWYLYPIRLPSVMSGPWRVHKAWHLGCQD